MKHLFHGQKKIASVTETNRLELHKEISSFAVHAQDVTILSVQNTASKGYSTLKTAV